jgi:hypothetical protein
MFFTKEQTETYSVLEHVTVPNAAAVVVTHAQLHH